MQKKSAEEAIKRKHVMFKFIVFYDGELNWWSGVIYIMSLALPSHRGLLQVACDTFTAVTSKGDRSTKARSILVLSWDKHTLTQLDLYIYMIILLP